jgi:hypothetical protein
MILLKGNNIKNMFVKVILLSCVNPLTPNDLLRRRAVNHLKIKIPSKKSQQAALNKKLATVRKMSLGYSVIAK